jgi:hypothetical protein
MNQIPVAIGIALCDQVIIEEVTHNVTPVNCFNARALDAVPGQTTFFVLAWLANGMGEMMAEVVIERLDTLEQIYRDQKKIVFGNRLSDSRFVARVRSCKFPVAGYYELSLIMNREVVAHRKFRIQQKGVEQ